MEEGLRHGACMPFDFPLLTTDYMTPAANTGRWHPAREGAGGPRWDGYNCDPVEVGSISVFFG